MRTRSIFNYDGYKRDNAWKKLIKNTPTLSAADLWKESEKEYAKTVAEQKRERLRRRALREQKEKEEQLLKSVQCGGVDLAPEQDQTVIAETATTFA